MTEAANANRAYNITVTVESVDVKQDVNGKEYISARVGCTLNGKPTTRTLVAKGKALEEVRSIIVPGNTGRIRCLFEKVSNDEGETNGQFLAAVGLPGARKAA